jgi:ferric-dicitrate binding protein FerR (iron transport regulator)
MRGELAFNDIPFEELAYDLERAYHISIEFKNEQLKDYHLTGVFKGENLNEVLQALQVTTPFKYEIAGQKVSIYK